MPEVSEETWGELAADGTVTIKHLEPEKCRMYGGALICVCRNDPTGTGFYPCLQDGTVVEPTGDIWLGDLYACGDCGRIISIRKLDVVGRRDPRMIVDEAADAGGWDD